MKKKKLSDKELSEMFSRLRKEDNIFEDLCNERNKIVRIIEHHEIVKNALYSELEKWDIRIDKIFRKLVEKMEK